ncbi:MAG: long-chain-fatty-acid--CoA ligase [Proteobacteria bacterium]|nr:long-chain-fatty-acid--CoA ligase [Pseudomonadota bacterium]
MHMTLGLHKALQQRPDAEAIRFMGRSTTYAQFGARVARLAGALRALGVKDGERVAMYSLNSQRYLEYDLAVPWAGGVLVPVNIRWSAAEVLYSLDDSGCEILIVDDTFKTQAASLAKNAKTLRHLIYAGDGETPAGMLNYETLVAQTEPIDDAYRHGEDLAGIFYTGGTTGFPKGVMLSHNNLGAAAQISVQLGIYGPGYTYLHAMPMFHLADFAPTIALFLCGGAHTIIPMYEPRLMLQTITAERPNVLLMAPTLMQMTLDWLAANPEAAREMDLSSLQYVLYGASSISQTLLDRTLTVFRSAKFIQGYGMTELAPTASLLMPDDHRGTLLRSAGRAVSGVELKIVDGQGHEVPRGTVGEVVVRGPNVMLGYWNKPEETAKAVRNGWMHTGDGATMDDAGYIFIADRIKDMIITGGENVYSGEVENALMSHPAVAQCAVIGVPSERWGEAVHAVIVPKAGAKVELASIQAHCRELIAGYKLPRSFEVRSALPMSSVGKVLKTELRKSFAAEPA